MKLKEKFDSIDQSKLNADQKDFLSKIEKATKNFTSDNKEVNDKVEGALDKMIATFKEKMPEAIKTKAEKKEPKATAKKATAKPSQTSSQKRTVMSVAKEIRKEGESWADAQKRAKAEMKKDKESATKEVKTEMDKLLAFIKTRKELDGISGTDLKRDSSREAKPRGRRISKDGNVYYENRENRIDRLAPNYPKDAPMLAKGGMLSPRERYNLEIKGMTGVSVGAIEKYIDENNLNDNDILNIVVGLGRKQLNGADVSTAMVGKKGNAESKKLIRFVKDDKAMKLELGGNVGGYDLAGHLDGTFNVGQDDGALSGVSGTSYSGLVGETGAMSSGEMFMNGGGIPQSAQHSYMVVDSFGNPAQHYENGGNVGGYDLAGNLDGNFNVGQNDGALSGFSNTSYSGLVGETGTMSSGEMFAEGGYLTDPTFGQFQAGVYAEGGSLENHGIKEGDTFVKTIAGGIQKVKDKDGKIVFINLATGERDSQPPLPFSDGGKVTYFVNKDGIKVRSVAKPDKELSEKEWMSKHSESKEARAYADGGDIEAFSMRMVKGSSASPTEVLTEEKEVKFAKGGSLREKRNDYLSKLGDKEADVWDKIGANSGTKIRGDKKMLKAYAEGVEEMLIEENVQGRSFDQEDYDFYTDQNWHLFNDFLVWNGYYKPAMTIVEKKWREKAFKEGNIYVSDPEVITVKGVSPSKSKSKNYIVHADIESITVKKDGKEIKVKGSDVLNGANILKKGGELSELAIYYPKRSIVSVKLKNGKDINPANGYWVLKTPKMSRTQFEEESFEYKKGGKVPFAEKSKAIAKNFEGKPVEPKHQKEYGKTYDAKEAKEVGDKIAGAQKASYDAKLEKGGEIEDVLKNAKNASKKYGYDYYVYSNEKGEISLARKSEFERLFDKDDLKLIYKVDGNRATKVIEKAESGTVVKRKSGNPKMKEAMVLAKKIRKDGEKWTDAVKRAYAQVK